MKLVHLLNLLPSDLHLFGPGTRIQNLVQRVIKKVNKCPNCGNLQFKKNRLRCFHGWHWFCLDCSLCFITAVDCPICYKDVLSEYKNKQTYPEMKNKGTPK